MSDIKSMRERAYREYVRHKGDMNKALEVVRLLDRLRTLQGKPEPKKRTMSAEARRRMSIAAKKRWARRAQ